jgi:hypothetical protein
MLQATGTDLRCLLSDSIREVARPHPQLLQKNPAAARVSRAAAQQKRSLSAGQDPSE